MKRNNIIHFLDEKLAAILLIVFFLTEAIGKYFNFYSGEEFIVQKYAKAVVFVGFSLLLIRFVKDLAILLGLLLMFFIGQLFIPAGTAPPMVLLALKLIFPLLLFLFFNRKPLTARARDVFFKTFEYLLIFNGFLIFIGWLTSFYLFKSYAGHRWGYNGLFLNTSGSSYIYAIAIFYCLLRYRKYFLTNWKSIVIILSALMTGTKILYISILVSFLIWLFYYWEWSLQKKVLVSGIFLLLMSFAFYFIFFKIGFFDAVYEKEGIGAALFSFRNNLLMERTIPFIQEYWSLPNYIFGGINDLTTRSEMGFIDLIYFFGFGGAIVFLVFYLKMFLNFSLDSITIYLLITLGIVVFLSGNFFEKSAIAIYLVLLKEVMRWHNSGKERTRT